MKGELTQKEIVLRYVADRGIQGCKKHEVMAFCLDHYITCADRILRRLHDDGKVVGVVLDGEKEKTWYITGLEKGELL